MVSSMQGACRIAFIMLPALALQIAGPGAIAQGYADYPSRPVSIIVPFEGNGIDQDLRVFVQTMNLPAGGTFVFEAKAGAAGAAAATIEP